MVAAAESERLEPRVTTWPLSVGVPGTVQPRNCRHQASRETGVVPPSSEVSEPQLP